MKELVEYTDRDRESGTVERVVIRETADGYDYAMHYGTLDGETLSGTTTPTACTNGTRARTPRRSTFPGSIGYSAGSIARSKRSIRDPTPTGATPMPHDSPPTDDRPTLTVRVDDTEGIRSDALDAVDAATAGEEPAPMHTLGLGSDDELARLMSETNLELLRTIATEEPESMRALADLVDRDYREVHRNLEELEQLNVIEFEDTGYRKRPRVRYDALEVQIQLREPAEDTNDDVREAATAD